MGARYSQRRVVAACLAASLLTPIWSLSSPRRKQKEVFVLAFPNGEEEVYERGPIWWSSGPIIARVEAGCVGFDGTLQPFSFFKKLKATKTSEGVTFRQGPRIISDYPDEVRLWIQAAPCYCSAKERSFLLLPPWPTGDWPSDAVKTPRAEAAYLRDLRLHPLEIDLAEEGEIGNVSALPRTPGYEPLHSMEYTFVIRTKGVRLADPLVVDLFSKNGEKFARFIFRP
jgi:hypothetical protein